MVGFGAGVAVGAAIAVSVGAGVEVATSSDVGVSAGVAGVRVESEAIGVVLIRSTILVSSWPMNPPR